MRRVAVIAILAMVLASLATTALAWEFKMKGETVWRYRYLTRTGLNDIFGRMGPLADLGINHLKTWPSEDTNNAAGGREGVLAGEPGFGTDANMTDLRATFYPKIKVNKAISLSGSINCTSLGIHSGGRPYDNAPTGYTPANQGGFFNSLWVPTSERMAGANVPNMFVTVQWWKISLKLPWFKVSTGTKTSNFGLGFWKNKCQRASTSFSVTAGYGPFHIGFSPYFSRTRSDWDVFARDSVSANNPWRKDDDRDYTRGYTFGLSYINGPLIIALMQDYHVTESYRQATGAYVSRQGNGEPGNKPAEVGIPHPDQWVSDAAVSVKYFNGRFFFNAEVDHFWQYRSGRGIAEGLFGPDALLVDRDEDQNAWMYAVELGTLCGPGKITLSYFRATGDDPSTRKTNEDARAGDAGVSSCYVRDWAVPHVLLLWNRDEL